MKSFKDEQAVRPMRRRALAVGGAAALAPTVLRAQSAERYPSRMIKLVVPYTPGGLIDTFTRHLADNMSARLGQPVVVENRPGASQTIGMDAVARSAPDGYTLFVTSQTGMILNPLTRCATSLAVQGGEG